MLTTDLRFAARTIWRSRNSSGFAVLTLALAIGGAVAVAALVDRTIVRPVPYPGSERLVDLYEATPRSDRGGVAPQNFLDWQQKANGFDALAAVRSGRAVITEAAEPTRVPLMRATPYFFDILGTAPLFGETSASGRFGSGDPAVAVISYGFWQRQFGGSPDVLGKNLRLDDTMYQVLAVMPRDFEYPLGASAADVFLPLVFSPDERERGKTRSFSIACIGRLRSGVSPATAAAELNAIAEQLEAQNPVWNKDRRIALVEMREGLAKPLRPLMYSLAGAVALLFLIACANVSGVLLIRLPEKTRQIAMKSALGASLSRISREAILEAALLSMTACVFGGVIGSGLIQLLRTSAPSTISRGSAVAVDFRVVLFAAAITLIATVVCACVPVLFFARKRIADESNMTSARVTHAPRARRMASGLIVLEVALSSVLVVGAALFLMSFVRLAFPTTGLDTKGVFAMDVPRRLTLENRRTGAAYLETLLRAVDKVPGVVGAATISEARPLTALSTEMPFQIDGRSLGPDDLLALRTVSAHYLDVLGIPILLGRNFAPTMPEVVINERAVALCCSGSNDPIGRQLVIEGQAYTIVGIVKDVQQGQLGQPVKPEAYLPVGIRPVASGTLVVRTKGEAGAVMAAVKRAVWSVNPAQPVTEAWTFEETHFRSSAQRRFNAIVATLLAALSLAAIAAGIYATFAGRVRLRHREIAIRFAMGANRAIVSKMLLVEAFWLVGVGLATGLAIAWLSTKAVAELLFGVTPHDATAFAATAFVVFVVAVVAVLSPVAAANRVNPVELLKAE